MNDETIVAAFETWLRAASPAARVERRSDGIWARVPDLDPVAMAETMNRLEVPLTTMTAVADDDGQTRLIYHYAGRGAAINVETRTQGGVVRSIAPVSPAANWIEREIHDLYAVVFAGHPDLARLIRPPQLSDGFFREPGGSETCGRPNGAPRDDVRR